MKEFSTQDVLIGRISRVYLLSDYLIITEYNVPDKLIHLFDKNYFNHLASTTYQGQGPGEITIIGHVGTDEAHRRFFVSDHGKLKIFSYDLDSVLANPDYQPEVKMNMKERQFPDRYLYLNDTLCIARIIEPIGNSDYRPSVARWNMTTEEIVPMKYEYPDLKNVAAICVYPNFAAIVKNTLEVDGVNIACVSGGFPSSQTFIEVKVAETALAIADGADEIDIVISIGKFLSGDYEGMCEEIQELKEVCKERHLKVILETGALKSASNIKKASILSMYSGADFIKTSTGKQQPAATPEAAYVMCEAIKEYYQKTGNKIGFKPAGGINTVNDAIIYYTIVKELLGKEWLDNQLFRLGTSRLANLLLSDIKGEEIKFF